METSYIQKMNNNNTWALDYNNRNIIFFGDIIIKLLKSL